MNIPDSILEKLAKLAPNVEAFKALMYEVSMTMGALRSMNADCDEARKQYDEATKHMAGRRAELQAACGHYVTEHYQSSVDSADNYHKCQICGLASSTPLKTKPAKDMTLIVDEPHNDGRVPRHGTARALS